MMIRSLENVQIPSAIDNIESIRKKLGQKKPAVFLDFDGTLAPIVDDPAKAEMPDSLKKLLESLSEETFVAVISGRGLEDLKKKVPHKNIICAGSHGFEISGKAGISVEKKGEAFLPVLDAVELHLKENLKEIPGSWVERKKFAIAVHYRNSAPGDETLVKEKVVDVLAKFPELKQNPGKKVLDIKPAINWHKGEALLFLFRELIAEKDDVLPIFVGDDITDEDAFRSIKQVEGIGVIVEASNRATEASYSLEDIQDVEEFLKKMLSFIKEIT